MTRKTLTRNTIEISFLDSSDENDEICFPNWKLYDSSDDESCKNKSEVLWSRDNDYFVEKDLFRNTFDCFSDITEGTISSCSWHNDEFDMRSTNRVRESIEAIDDFLYEKTKSSINQEVIQECHEWSDKFPYFRLKGNQIIKPVEDSVLLYSPPSKHVKGLPENSSSGLQVEGKKLIIHTPDRFLKKICFDNENDNSNKIPDCFEELIENDGEYEECLAVDESKAHDEISSIVSKEESIELSSYRKAMQEKIIERIALEMWPRVLDVLQNVNDIKKYDENVDFQLPPIISVIDHNKSNCYQRPKTEGTQLPLTEFPKLNSILSVSPKILQKKDCIGFSQKTRPTSETSFRRSQTVISLNGKNSCIQNSKFYNQKAQDLVSKVSSSKETRKSEKDTENFCLFLPSLEEDYSPQSDILRGFHIEPEIKENSHKSILSAKFSEVSNISRKPECFLPPIEDKEHIATNIKLTKNLFTFYGPSGTSDKDRNLGSSFGKNICGSNSRPNTSSSRKDTKMHGILEHKLLKNNYINNNEKKTIENISHSNQRTFNKTKNDMEETKDTNAEKSVSLFPIVTSLVPYKEKSLTTVKKGIFHAFVGRKR